jgi:hypothetical protein
LKKKAEALCREGMLDISCTLKKLQLSQTQQSLKLFILKAGLLLACIRKLFTNPIQLCFKGGSSRISLLKVPNNLLASTFKGSPLLMKFQMASKLRVNSES